MRETVFVPLNAHFEIPKNHENSTIFVNSRTIKISKKYVKFADFSLKSMLHTAGGGCFATCENVSYKECSCEETVINMVLKPHVDFINFRIPTKIIPVNNIKRGVIVDVNDFDYSEPHFGRFPITTIFKEFKQVAAGMSFTEVTYMENLLIFIIAANMYNPQIKSSLFTGDVLKKICFNENISGSLLLLKEGYNVRTILEAGGMPSAYLNFFTEGLKTQEPNRVNLFDII